MSMVAWHLGNQIASSIAGNLESLIALRKAFIDSFADGVQKAKLVQPPPSSMVPPDLRGPE